MALSNSQYNELMRIYEQRQLDAVHQVQERYERVTQAIPEFAEIDNAISSASIRQARLLLNGETSALADLKQEIPYLPARKNYSNHMDIRLIIWSRIISARTAKTRAISERINATASKKQLWIYYIHSQTCRRF